MPRRSAFGRLLDHFHTHPRGRVHEFLFWFGLGAVLGLFAWFGYRADWLSQPIAWILGVVALSLIGWSFLPQHKTKPAPPKSPLSKRRK